MSDVTGSIISIFYSFVLGVANFVHFHQESVIDLSLINIKFFLIVLFFFNSSSTLSCDSYEVQ